MKKKLSTAEAVLTALAVVFAVAPVLLAAFYYEIYPVLHAVDALIIIFFILEVCILIAALWRLLATMNSDSFSAGTLVPAAAALLLGVLSFVITSDIDTVLEERRFESSREQYSAAVEYLDASQYSRQMELPPQYSHLSRDGKVLAYSCNGGKNICYLFVRLDHENRYEGILYVSGNTPVLYYEITDQYSSYSYKELRSNYVRIVLYK